MKIIVAIIMFFISLSAFGAWSVNSCVMPEGVAAKCVYLIDEDEFTVSAHGEIGYKDSRLQIRLPEHFVIEEVRGGQIVDDTAFLSFAITDHESGSTIIAAVSREKQILKWAQEFRAFNSSPLLIEGNEIYIGGIGTVARYNATDGKLVWELKDLYEEKTQAFVGFAQPVLHGKNVEFVEDKAGTATYEGVRKLVVKRSSGKLISK